MRHIRIERPGGSSALGSRRMLVAETSWPAAVAESLGSFGELDMSRAGRRIVGLERRGQRTGVPDVNVEVTAPITIVRMPVPPELANGSFAEKTSPDVMVNEVAVPIAVPLPFRNEMLPVQDAAVPDDEFAAEL
jgi:hypothetical protein